MSHVEFKHHFLICGDGLEDQFILVTFGGNEVCITFSSKMKLIKLKTQQIDSKLVCFSGIKDIYSDLFIKWVQIGVRISH